MYQFIFVIVIHFIIIIQIISAGDAHDLTQLGKYATWLPNMVYTLDDFVAEIKKGISKPTILGDGGYNVVDVWDNGY